MNAVTDSTFVISLGEVWGGRRFSESPDALLCCPSGCVSDVLVSGRRGGRPSPLDSALGSQSPEGMSPDIDCHLLWDFDPSLLVCAFPDSTDRLFDRSEIDSDDRHSCKWSMDFPGLLSFTLLGPVLKLPIMMRNFGGPSCRGPDLDVFESDCEPLTAEAFCNAPLVAFFVNEEVFCLLVIVSVLIPESSEAKASSS